MSTPDTDDGSRIWNLQPSNTPVSIGDTYNWHRPADPLFPLHGDDGSLNLHLGWFSQGRWVTCQDIRLPIFDGENTAWFNRLMPPSPSDTAQYIVTEVYGTQIEGQTIVSVPITTYWAQVKQEQEQVKTEVKSGVKSEAFATASGQETKPDPEGSQSNTAPGTGRDTQGSVVQVKREGVKEEPREDADQAWPEPEEHTETGTRTAYWTPMMSRSFPSVS